MELSKSHDAIVKVALSSVPRAFLEDARQAAYLGLIKGLRKQPDASRGYLYRCAKNEILKELGNLHSPYSLNKDIFILMLKYKTLKQYRQEAKLNLDEKMEMRIEKIIYSSTGVINVE